MTIIYIILFITIVFSDTIGAYVPFGNYWDEAMLALAIVYYSVRIIKGKRLRIKGDGSFTIVLIIILIGIVGNLLHPDFQGEREAIVKDILAFAKFPLAMILLRDLNINHKKSLKSAVIVSRALVILNLILAVVGYFINIGVYNDSIRITKSYTGFYTHPTFCASALVIILITLIAEGKTRNSKYIIGTCILLFLTQRTKSYAIVIITLILIYVPNQYLKKVIEKFNQVKKIKLKYIIFVGIVLFIAGWFIGRSKISLYMGYGLSAARPALYLVGLQMASELFPFGSGFGTFASSLSGEYYSNVYRRYNIAGVSGLTRELYNYMGDTFWPYIYGQFGYIGLFLYIKLLWNLFVYQVRKQNNYSKTIALIIFWAYALIASAAEAFFTNVTGIQMALVLTVYIGFSKNNIYNLIQKEIGSGN